METAAHASHTPAASACANCGTPLGGTYCSACGQKAVSHDVSLHDLSHEALHELAHVDGKIVQTLKLLITKPGFLTTEFLAGRRARYISPVRLYLTCSLIFFALAAVAPVDERPFFRITPGGRSGFSFASEEQLREATVEANRAIIHGLPRVMFVLMPVFAFGTWLLYRKARRFYAAHLYYSIHFHAFAFLALTLMVSLRLARGYAAVVFVANLIPSLIWIYQYVGLRRVFGGSVFQKAWKGTVLNVLYTGVVFTAMLGLGLLSVASSQAHSAH